MQRSGKSLPAKRATCVGLMWWIDAPYRQCSGKTPYDTFRAMLQSSESGSRAKICTLVLQQNSGGSYSMHPLRLPHLEVFQVQSEVVDISIGLGGTLADQQSC